VGFSAAADGRGAFDHQPLDYSPRAIVLNRYDTVIRFIRVGP
jgi:hypothetical protein